MEKLLIYLKHNVPWIWKIIEGLNGFLFTMFNGKKLDSIINKYLPFTFEKAYIYRKLELNDLVQLSHMLGKETRLDFFKPHGFDLVSIENIYKNKSFLMMGVFDGDKFVGYYFLRFFANRKAFIGRMVSSEYQRKGIAKEMSRILYGITWDIGFKCLTTISEKNEAIFDLHQKEGNVRFLKTLNNKYHLVEILPDIDR